MFSKLKLRTFDSIGCSVVATSIINSLKNKFPKLELEIYTKFPELFKGIKRVKTKKPKKINFDVDLSDFYTKRKPHNTKPYRPIYIHMLEIAEEQLSIKLKKIKPLIKLSKNEIKWARKKIKDKKPVMWIQSKTNSINKNWFDDYWKVLFKKFKDYKIIDLSKSKFSLRESLAIAKVCKGGIALDSFLIHGSAAVGAKNVLALLGSSRKEVVSYPSQTVIYIKNCTIQPCGMHGYGIGCKREDEKLFIGHKKTRCIFDDYRCMKTIKPEIVISKFYNMIQ